MNLYLGGHFSNLSRPVSFSSCPLFMMILETQSLSGRSEAWTTSIVSVFPAAHICSLAGLTMLLSLVEQSMTTIFPYLYHLTRYNLPFLIISRNWISLSGVESGFCGNKFGPRFRRGINHLAKKIFSVILLTFFII